jgi:hypothetical protein
VTELFREHHVELVRLALIMVQDLPTAEDVVQDAFERLHLDRGLAGGERADLGSQRQTGAIRRVPQQVLLLAAEHHRARREAG